MGARLLPGFPPSGASRLFGDGAAAAGAEGGGARRSTLESAETAEGGGVGIRLMGEGAAGQDFDAFGRGVAARAGRAYQVGVFRFDAFFDEVADQTAPADGEQDGRRFTLDA
jgi:hypothetical protein